jgi:hypothetical protein
VKGIPPTSFPLRITPAVLQAVDIALRDTRVRRIVGDRRVTLHEAYEDLGTEGGDQAVGAGLVFALDRAASIDDVFPSWICRGGRYRGIKVHATATHVRLIEVTVDNRHRRVQSIDPSRWYPTDIVEVPGTVPFTEVPCDNRD